LAQQIDALVAKDELRLAKAREMAQMRRGAAVQLHQVCADFVISVNQLTTRIQLSLDPEEYNANCFKENGPNLLQINVSGRILQIEFEAAEELICTEDFRVPYTMKGAIRCFNQDLLDQDVIEEQLLFYVIEKQPIWRFFDARTYRSGPFDEEYLATLMEHLV
jgi:hypothetical protein